MKGVTAILVAVGIGAFVWATASAGGRQEGHEGDRASNDHTSNDRARPSRNEERAEDLGSKEPHELMRRVSAIGARFGAHGGSWTEVELPEEYQGQPAPAGTGRDFRTDFSRHRTPAQLWKKPLCGV